MKVRKAIKKIVALSTGALFVGATVLGAMAAADLKDYPKPLFVKEDGTFDGIVVVGNSAAAEDVIGATNIMAALQRAATVKTLVEGSQGTVVLGGDSKKIEQATNKLEMEEELRGTGITSVTNSDLSALKKGTVKNEFGDFTYTQYIELPLGAKIQFALDPDDDTDIPKDYLIVNQSKAYQYKLSFTPALKSDDRTDSLEDLENKKIKMLGKDYTIVTAAHTARWNIALTLMGGAVEDTLEEYTTKTYTFGDKEYKVKVLAIATESSTLKVKFQINDEVTDPLVAGETYALEDGTEIGVRDLLENEGTEEGGADVVTFFLGAEKIILTDTNTSLSDGAGEVQVGSNKLDNVKLDIISSSDEGTTDGNDVYLSEIDVFYTPSQNLYIPKDGKLSVVADTAEDETGNVFLDGFDMEYKGLEVGKTESIKFKPSGSNNYKLDFYNKAGDHFSQNLYAWSGTANFLGERSGSTNRDLITAAATPVSDEEYVVIGDGNAGGTSSCGYGRILQFKSTSNGDNMYKIKDIGTGETYSVTYDSAGTGTLVVDGYSTTVTGDGDSSTTLNFSTARNYICTQLGAKISFANATHLDIQSEKAEDGSTTDTLSIEMNHDGTDLNLNGTTKVTGMTLLQHGDDDYYNDYSTKYGMFMKYDKPTTGQDSLELTYPDNQVTAAVFVTTGAVTEETSSGDGVYSEKFVSIPVSASKLSSEVADITAQNAIVVGGPCANPAAAELMGNPENCAAGFEEGKAMIKLFTNDGKVAMLVAGYSALDTRRATSVLADPAMYKSVLVGDEVVVSGTKLTDIKVSKPVVVAEEPIVE